MVHGKGTRADGRRSRSEAHLSEISGSRDGRAAVEIMVNKSYVVSAQAGYLVRPTTESPETQIYFINHRSGAFPELRLRTVVRGERASRSIVNSLTALWSIGVVSSLILAGLGIGLVFEEKWGREVAESRGSNGISEIAQWPLIRARRTLPLTNGRKRT